MKQAVKQTAKQTLRLKKKVNQTYKELKEKGFQ